MGKKLTQKEFIEKANKMHDSYYNYDKVDYVRSRDKVVITCPIHGDFTQTPHSHLVPYGCNKCGNHKSNLAHRYTKETFIEKAVEQHGEVYSYKKVDYQDSRIKVTITCKKHGDFMQAPRHHLKGQGCPNCAIAERGYRKENFIVQAKGKLCTFYVLNCFNGQENFYKIGITKHSVKVRYSSTKRMPYLYKVISEVLGSAEDIYELEELEKKKLKKYSYQPKIKFGGSRTECFTIYN